MNFFELPELIKIVPSCLNCFVNSDYALLNCYIFLEVHKNCNITSNQLLEVQLYEFHVMLYLLEN